MNIAVLMVTALSALGGNCHAVDPIQNTVAWTQDGRVMVASYRDTGNGLRWDAPVPSSVRNTTTNGRGTALRVGCP